MRSTLEITCHNKMTAEEVLEEIKYPLENLENFLIAMTKMRVDHTLNDNDFSSIINLIHQQISDISNTINI